MNSAFTTGDRFLGTSDGEQQQAVVLDLSTGTHLILSTAIDFSIDDAGPEQRFLLRKGVVEANVVNLADGQRFTIRTSDAEIEGRGTSFRLTSGVAGVGRRYPCQNLTTRLTVNDGLVAMSLARLGLGLFYTNSRHLAPDLASGALELTLESYAPSSPGFFLYFNERKRSDPKLRAFVETMENPYLEKPFDEARLRRVIGKLVRSARKTP